MDAQDQKRRTAATADNERRPHARPALRAAAFVLLGCFLLWAMALLFSHHPDDRSFQSIGSFYQQPEGSLDGVYIGSSNCYAFWNPLIAWKGCGLAIHSYASSSQPFYATEYILRDCRKTQPDALYIINLNGVAEEEISAASIHNLVNFMPESENRDALIDELGSLLGYSKLEKLEFRFLWTRGREYFLDYLEHGFFSELNGMMGASDYESYLTGQRDISDTYIQSDARAALPDALAESLNRLLDYCDAEQVKVIFVAVPRAEDSEAALARINAAADAVRARGYEALCLTDEYEAIGLDLSRDYYDRKHVNIHGSVKYTLYLARYLMENCDLEGGRADAEDWDAAWARYAEEVSSCALDFELAAAPRDTSLSAPDALRAEAVEGGVRLSWSAVDGADGYRAYRKEGEDGAWASISDTLAQTDCFDAGGGAGLRYAVASLREAEGEILFGNASCTAARAEEGEK